MALLKLKSENFILDIESTQPLSVVTKEPLELCTLLFQMSSTVPLLRFRVLMEAASGQFSYIFTTEDGREWAQKLYVLSSGDYMTFDVSDLWKLNEFSLQRSIRDLVIFMIKGYGIEEIDAKWTT